LELQTRKVGIPASQFIRSVRIKRKSGCGHVKDFFREPSDAQCRRRSSELPSAVKWIYEFNSLDGLLEEQDYLAHYR
jgi:hypothetical protein